MCLFADSAGITECLSSLSSGAGCERPRTAGCLMGALMMSIRSACFGRSRRERIALLGLRSLGGVCGCGRLQCGDASFAAAAELCSAWTDECVRPYAIKDKIGWGRARGPSLHRCLRLFRFRRLEVAALGTEISFTAAKFGEDVFQDAARRRLQESSGSLAYSRILSVSCIRLFRCLDLRQLSMNRIVALGAKGRMNFGGGYRSTRKG